MLSVTMRVMPPRIPAQGRCRSIRLDAVERKGERRKKGKPQEKGRQIHPQEQDEQEDEQIVQAHQGCEAGDHGKGEAQTDLPRLRIGVEDLQKLGEGSHSEGHTGLAAISRWPA